MSLKKDSEAVAIDYETFYDTKGGYSLGTMPTDAYCRDARFDPYLVAICGRGIYPDGEAAPKGCVMRDVEGGRQLFIGRPERFAHWNRLDGRILLAHNAAFDSVVTAECVKRGVIPELRDVEWQCTADLSAYLLAPRNLKGAMKELFGKEISKAVRAGMDGRHDYELDEAEYRDLVEYGGSDAVECHDIWERFSSEWPEIERLISTQNRDAIARGIRIDVDYAKAALKELKSYQSKVVLDIPWATQINPKTKEFYAVGSLPALRQAVVDLGVKPPKSFKKDDPGFLDWLKDNEGIPFIKARQVAVALSMHIARIEGILRSVDPEGNAHPAFLYFGAHTGRFSGKSDTSGVNINMLNMPRKPVFYHDPNVFDGKGVDIRGMYVPRPGYKFVVFDYSQIEARFALWLVNDTHMMEALKREGNLYQANAVAMGWCESGENIKRNDPDKYRLAKCCLASDTPVLVRSERSDGSLTSPCYKRIIHVKSTDKVWDGHEWVGHLGVERMKEVDKDELIEVGGVSLTKDHKVYTGETEARHADEILHGQEAAAVAWGESQNPVQGWSHVWILATYLARVVARTCGLAIREALCFPARALRLHRMRKGDEPIVGQRTDGEDDAMQFVRPESRSEESATERVGEDA